MTSIALNPQLSARAALQEPDDKAIVRLLSPLLMPGVTPEIFKETAIVTHPQDNTRAIMTVTVDKQNANVQFWPFEGSLPITYRRIGLDEVFSFTGNMVRVDLPASVRDVLSVFFRSNNLEDRSAQFADGWVDNGGTLQVSVQGEQLLLRGQGNLNVMPLQRMLEDVIAQTTVSGFRVVNDFDNSALALLTTQLRAVNADTLPYPLDSTELSLHNPTVLSGYVHDNTRITLRASGAGYYLGQVDVIYTRFDFGWYNNGEQFYVEGPRTIDPAYLLDQVSAMTGLPLALSDITTQNFAPAIEGDVQTVTLFFRPGNLRYVGELTIDYRAV